LVATQCRGCFDEFAVLLPETDLEEASGFAERLRCAISERAIPCGANHIAATVSIGAAAADSVMENALALMKRADEALYEAKRSGRNRVATKNRLSVVKQETAVA
jgi:two-component system cell cycle response regulator